MQLAEEIRAYCREHADPRNAQKWQRYFREGYDAWGLLDPDNPFFNEKRDEWLRKYKRLGLPGFLKLGEELVTSGKYEEASISINFLKSFRDELTAAYLPALGRWFAAGIRNWAHTDVMCMELLSPLLIEGRLKPADFTAWRAAGPRFQRRAVPVALVPLVKQAKSVAPLLKFIEPMMRDDERVVHQGLGWFLRECWKKEPSATEAFLLKWKEDAARLIYQYATEKMPKPARERFRRAKRQ